MQLVSSIHVRHFPFLESLAGSASEESPEWKSYSAVFHALRLIDLTALGVPLTESALAITRESADGMPDGDSMTPLLGRLLDSIELNDTAGIAAALRDIGRAYLSRASWSHALDVYETAQELARKAKAHELLLEAMHGAGHAIRMLRRFDDAAQHYALLRRTARRLGSVRFRLEARLGMAKMAIDRGNFPAAAALLDRVIAQARAEKCTVVLSKALQDRARVAGECEDHELSLRLGYKAMEYSEDARERDRILCNVARGLAMLGERTAARDANLVLAHTAQDQDVRWVATINLMEIAYLDRHESVFEEYRISLAAEPLPPALAAWYYECVGAGCTRFVRRADSRVAYERMLALGIQYDLAEATIKAEQALAGNLEASSAVNGKRMIRRTAIRRIATAVTGLRIAAGVAG